MSLATKAYDTSTPAVGGLALDASRGGWLSGSC